MGKWYAQKVSRKIFQICKMVLKLSHIKRSVIIKATVIHILEWQKVKPLVIFLVPSLWENRLLHMNVNIHNLYEGLLDNIHQNKIHNFFTYWFYLFVCSLQICLHMYEIRSKKNYWSLICTTDIIEIYSCKYRWLDNSYETSVQ